MASQDTPPPGSVTDAPASCSTLSVLAVLGQAEQARRVMASCVSDQDGSSSSAGEAATDGHIPSDLASPRWEEGGSVHNWRRYVTEEVRSIWGTFTPEQQAALYRQAEEMAGKEEWE